jgi:hypothetical protein
MRSQNMGAQGWIVDGLGGLFGKGCKVFAPRCRRVSGLLKANRTQILRATDSRNVVNKQGFYYNVSLSHNRWASLLIRCSLSTIDGVLGRRRMKKAAMLHCRALVRSLLLTRSFTQKKEDPQAHGDGSCRTVPGARTLATLCNHLFLGV